MRIHGFMLGLGLWVGLGTVAFSQNAQPDPVIPPVEVRPPEEAVLPENRPLADPFAEFSPISYPPLRQQDFSGLNSATMSSRSIYDLPQPGTILDRNDLDERQPQDMYRALQQEVGVLMQRTAAGQSSPFIRGLTGQQILVLIDGVRMNNSTYRAGPNQYFNLIDPGQVERIEVVRGAGSVLYGSDAIGGVINVVTKSASRNRGIYGQGQFIEYFSTADAASYTRTNVEGWSGNTGVFAGASYMNVNDLDIGGDGRGRQPFTNFDQYAADVKVDRLLADNVLLTVALQHFEQNDLPRSDRFNPFVQTPVTNPPQPIARPTFFDVQQRDLAYVRLMGTDLGDFIDGFSVTGMYGRNKEGSTETRIPPDPNAGRVEQSEFDVNTGGIQFVFATETNSGVLTYGTDYYYDHVDATRIRTSATPPSQQNPQFPNGSDYARAGAFISWDVDLTDDLSMITGVRYENAHTTGVINQVSGLRTPFNKSYDNWASSCGFVYELTDYVNLCTNFTEAFRAPNLDDLTADNSVQQGGQDLPSLNVQSERAYIYDVGMKFDAPRLRGQAFFFWNDLQNAIQRQPITPGSQNFIRSNFDAYIYGAELAGEYLFDGGWSTYGNFFYTFGEDVDRDEPYSRIPPTQGILGLRYRDWNHRGWIDFYTWMVDRQDRYAAQNLTDARFPAGGTPGFATLNLRLGTTLGEYDQHQVSVTFENMTDKGYRVLGSGVEGTGFNAILGWQYTR